MFDANARHIPTGEKFFIEVHSLANSYLYQKLLKEGNVYLCEKISDTPSEYNMRIYLNATCKDYITVKDSFDEEDYLDNVSFFVYSGLPSGKGFIDNKYKQKALDFLGGEWYGC